MSKSDPKTERLAAVAAFAGCEQKELDALASIADETTIDAGTTLITQGERLHFAYVVEEGTATVVINAETVGSVGAGEVLGEISMFDPAPAAATVVATTSMRVLALRFDALEAVIRNHPDLAISLLRTMAKRFRTFQT